MDRTDTGEFRLGELMRGKLVSSSCHFDGEQSGEKGLKLTASFGRNAKVMSHETAKKS